MRTSRVGDGKDKPAFPPGLVNRTANRIVRVFKNITIEPAMFLIAFSSNMDDLATSQMTIYKSCRLDFNYNETVCDNLVQDYKEENKLVQQEIAQFAVYQTMVRTVFPIFFSFYMGAWCDLFGRKLLFYIYFTAKILEQTIIILCAYFLETPKEYLLVSNLPTSLAGGFGVWILAVNAFIADITEPENRAFRYGMLHLASSLGRPLAAPAGAYLLDKGGYVCVFTASLVGTFLGVVFMIVRVWSYKWNPEKKGKQRSAFSPKHAWDCIKTTFKKREGPNRKYILIFMFMTALSIMPFIGEGSIAYNYVRTRYEWDIDEYSTYSSIVSASSLVGQAIFIPLISVLGISESLVMTMLFSSITLRHVIKAFASKPWMYYLGGLVDVVGGYAFSILRAMSVTCVLPDELGKINAVLSAIESLLPVGIVQGYATLWKATDSTFPGAVFLASTSISLIALSLSIYVHISLRGRRIGDVTKAGAGRLTPEELNEKRKIEDRKLSPSTFENISSVSYI